MGQDDEAVIKSFVALGLSEQKARETCRNAAVTKTLLAVLHEVRGVVLPEGAGALLYHLATKIKPQIAGHLPLLTQWVVARKLDTAVRVDRAIEYALSHLGGVDAAELARYCGVGVVVSPEDVERSVERCIGEIRAELLEKRYKYNVGLIMQRVRGELPWADGKAVKNEIAVQIFDLLGPKTDTDLAPAPKPDKRTKPGEKLDANPPAERSSLTVLDVMRNVGLHAPGQNFKTDGYVVTERTRALLAEHLAATGGAVRTRFPPEPNGVLHIGHAKAININFGYAAAHGGLCFLRYDDTNPKKEEGKFFDAIREMVAWLGYTPSAISHSSDYFDQLYEWAVRLVEKGFAYVCHQTADEMKGFSAEPSPWRDRPVAENLRLFQDMKNGKIDEGAATLRMKLTLEEGKLDPVAYRIRFVAHHRTGDAWCIYPTYDYTHCLCDSIEQITHSLCTKEFQSRRSSYYWLCNALDIYCPVQWEYGRLKVNHTVVSKRKIARLIEEGVVRDWDDPRLFTLTALRRRGFPPEAINNFCAQLGVTGAQTTVDPGMLEAYVRAHLDVHAPRTMVVLNPLKVTIRNFPYESPVKILVPDYPAQPENGAHHILLARTVYIERDDFAPVAAKGFRRLTATQGVGLRHAGLVLDVVEAVADGSGGTAELVCECTPVDRVERKPKAFVHWVSDPQEVDVRIYDLLFRHKNPEDPGEVPGGFLSDCNPDSLRVVGGYADRSLLAAKPYDRFQFERSGFYSVDPDSTRGRLVFNRTVPLKEEAGK